MAKVLRIINRFNLGGPTYNVAYLSKYLSTDFDTLLIGGMKDETEDSSEFIVNQLALHPKIIPEMRREISLVNDWKAYQKIATYIDEFKPDIVHTHASKAGTLGRLAAHRKKVPVVVHTFHGHVFHSYFGKVKTTFYKNIERYLAKLSTRIIAISERQKEELITIHRIANPNRVEVVPLGFDLARFQKDYAQKRSAFRAANGIKENEVAIGIVGRLVPIKNHEMFLRGIKNIIDETDIRIKAFVIGDGELMSHLRLAATRIGLGYNDPGKFHFLKPLHFTSWIRAVEDVYPGLDIVCLTSYNEGTPVSLIEAQAAQKPVISTNVGGIENVVSDGETGYLVDVNNDEQFAKRLITLVENKALRTEMGKKGAVKVTENFSYKRLCRDMEALYRKLLNEQSLNS